MRILLVTRSYPSPGDLYQYPFVHRRVLAYAAAGHEVAVFRPGSGPGEYSYEGVTCRTGDGAALSALVTRSRPDVVAAHGLSEDMWFAIRSLADDVPIRAWLHGSEIPGIFRAKSECLTDPTERSAGLDAVQRRCEFWSHLLANKPAQLKLVFVSRSAAELARQDMPLREEDFLVVHNPIDTELFAYRPKAADDRMRVLMIRPFDSYCYGNDMAVAAISRLRHHPRFERLSFTIIGDGPQFDETVAPIREVPNVSLHRRFLKQAEIAEQHRRHGIFLVPTRLDTQGVSRDEAMSSGLVPVTNVVSAVPEFVDETCASLAAADDSEGLANVIWELASDPDLFLSKSAAAAARVRRQTGSNIIIPQELALLAEAARG